MPTSRRTAGGARGAAGWRSAIRHELTDYDRLMRVNGRGHGLTREEARMVVAQEVEDLAAAWRQGSPEADPVYVAFRRDLSKRRQKKGRRKDNAGVIANENAAVATFLTDWLAVKHGAETTKAPAVVAEASYYAAP